ncbi:MAG TPA: circularly permuted type 2 ATP-grasp protein [Candidatus Limnocylindria bacterium]|nr:circularly permuted type 2 ATP-grasp protein [Candidatus Limnocylindria bacterium]
MSGGSVQPSRSSSSPADAWHALLRPDVELTPAFCAELAARMRSKRLTFGDRVHCPFLRPFFISETDEVRVRPVAEAIAALGERVVEAALASRDLLAQVGLNPEEERLARIEPGYKLASTASRLDAFLLPDSLQFAEYNAESPAGLGYAETLAEVFRGLPIMARFEERFRVESYPLSSSILDALLASYRDWGGTAARPLIAIVDWREVPTWSEFEILRERFEARGIPALISDPRDLVFGGHTLSAQGKKIDLVYRRVLINDIVSNPAECKDLVQAYESRAVCVANTFRCKIPHKKAFFAVLTDERNEKLFSAAEHALIRRHVPWTRRLEDTRTTRDGEPIDLLKYVRANRENFVMKPNDEYGGTGVTLGWETDPAAWDAAIEKALAEQDKAWVVQEKIKVRREIFPYADSNGGVAMRDMLVDFAPYLFRGRLSGYLCRLSATGLANVTSGGGQVPVFRVSPRS